MTEIKDTSWREDPTLRHKLPHGVAALQGECCNLRDEIVQLEEDLSVMRRAKLDAIGELEHSRSPIQYTRICQGFTVQGPASCGRCGRRDGLNVFLTDEIWAKVSEAADGALILCLWCIDELCGELSIRTTVTLQFHGKHIDGTSRSEADEYHTTQYQDQLRSEIKELGNKKEVLKSALLLVLHFLKKHPPFWTAESNTAWDKLYNQLIKKLKPLREIPEETLG